MARQVTSGFLVILLVAGLLCLAFSSQPVAANGTIYIRADGSIDPPTALIQRNGDYYTLLGDISSSTHGIIIERDDIVIDGTGWSIEGPRSGIEPEPVIGIDLIERNNVTIRNCIVRNFTAGIHLTFSNHSQIVDNIVEDNYFGILLYGKKNYRISSHNLVSNNTANRNQLGIYVNRAHYNSICTNSLDSNALVHIDIDQGSTHNDIFNNVMTNAKRDGFFITYNSSHNRVHDNIIHSSGWDGLDLNYNVTSNLIYNNEIYNSGLIRDSSHIYILRSSSNTFINNTLYDINSSYKVYGLYIDNSDNLTISHNNISFNDYGIYIWELSVNNNITKNNIYSNNYYNFYNRQIHNVSAKFNWWGTANITSIDQSIYDFHDNPTWGMVYFEPIATTVWRKPWDITGPTMWEPDGKCNIRDVALVALLFGSEESDGRYDVRVDITGSAYLVRDGKIDIRDIALVAVHFGEEYS